jgi:CRP-like cAMP-binding protein
MDNDCYCLLKNEISKLCSLSSNTWEDLMKVFTPASFPKRDQFAIEGENVKKFGFVCSGILRMYNLTESGKELTKHFITPGDFFVGAININEKNLVSIQSLTNCEILEADFNLLEGLSQVNGEVLCFKNNLVSRYVRMKQKRENNYLNLEAIERYRMLLKEFPNLVNEIPHHFIASYLGISTTQLSRVRRKILNT